jgi:high-affinity iron transporter
MFPGFLIGFREALEAALIVGIVIGYLKKTDRTHHAPSVWRAVGFAVIASIVAAWLFSSFLGGFEGAKEEWFEGTLMLIGAALITSAVLNLIHHLRARKEVETKVESTLTRTGITGLAVLVFLSVLREGVETIIFLSAANIIVPDTHRIGAILGIAVALLMGGALFKGLIRLPLKHFFTVTSFLLVLFAAGLTAHGIHELQEAGAIPVLTKEAWNINPPRRSDGTYPFMHDNGMVGSVLKGVLGYNGNPTYAEVIAYAGYLVALALVWKKILPSRPRPSETTAAMS